MMVAYEWEIDPEGMMKARENGHADVVTQIRWSFVAFDFDGSELIRRSGCLTPPMPEEGAEIIPFADLTKAQVEGWLDAMPTTPALIEEAEAEQRRRAAIEFEWDEFKAERTALPWE